MYLLLLFLTPLVSESTTPPTEAEDSAAKADTPSEDITEDIAVPAESPEIVVVSGEGEEKGEEKAAEGDKELAVPEGMYICMQYVCMYVCTLYSNTDKPAQTVSC